MQATLDAASCSDSFTKQSAGYDITALVPSAGSFVASSLSAITQRLDSKTGVASANPYDPAFVASLYNQAYELMGELFPRGN